MTFLYNVLGQLEQRTVLDTMAKEVVGINAPKILLTNSRDERIDSATSEIGNTLAFAGGGGALNLLLGRVFGRVQAQGGRAAQWAVLGRSGAIYSAIFAMMWAMPFVRNYFTTSRTGKLQFRDVIDKKNGAKGSDRKDVQSVLSLYHQKIKTILGLGAVGVALFATGGYLAARKNLTLGVLERLFKNGKPHSMLLKNGSFTDFSGWKAVLFWGLPAYGGWIHAARDPIETKEQLLKFAGFVAGFAGPQQFLKHYFKRKYAQVLPEGVEPQLLSIRDALGKVKTPELQGRLTQALSLWKKQNLWGLLSALLLLGSLPPAINLLLRNKRLAQTEPLRHQTAPVYSVGGLHHKTFAEWGYRR